MAWLKGIYVTKTIIKFYIASTLQFTVIFNKACSLVELLTELERLQ